MILTVPDIIIRKIIVSVPAPTNNLQFQNNQNIVDSDESKILK